MALTLSKIAVNRLGAVVGAPGVVEVQLEGELDLAAAATVQRALMEAIDEAERGVVVDLARVRFVDASCLGVLVGAMRRLRRRQARFATVSPRERPTRRVFELTQTATLLGLCATWSDAVALAAA